MIRVAALIVLALLAAVPIAITGRMLVMDADCQECCAPGGGCGAACASCTVCGLWAPGESSHDPGRHLLTAIPGALSHDEELSLPPSCTEILHIPKPALA